MKAKDRRLEASTAAEDGVAETKADTVTKAVDTSGIIPRQDTTEALGSSFPGRPTARKKPSQDPATEHGLGAST